MEIKSAIDISRAVARAIALSQRVGNRCYNWSYGDVEAIETVVEDLEMYINSNKLDIDWDAITVEDVHND